MPRPIFELQIANDKRDCLRDSQFIDSRLSPQKPHICERKIDAFEILCYVLVPFNKVRIKDEISNQQSAISNQQSAISNQQSAISNQQSAISNRSEVAQA
jgi:hypothetical protein